MALEDSDLYFLLRYWREGVIVHPAPSRGLLTSHITPLSRKAILGFSQGEKLCFANVHFTPWRGREGRKFSEVQLCRMGFFKSLPADCPIARSHSALVDSTWADLSSDGLGCNFPSSLPFTSICFGSLSSNLIRLLLACFLIYQNS